MGRRPSIPLEIRMKAFMIDPDDDELHEDTNETERFERYIKHSNDVALHIYNCIIIIDTHAPVIIGTNRWMKFIIHNSLFFIHHNL